MQDLSLLIQKSLNGSASAGELQLLLQQLDLQEGDLYQQWMQAASIDTVEAPYPAFNKEQVKALIEANKDAVTPVMPLHKHRIATWLRMGVAAAAVMLGLVWSMNYFYKADQQGVQTVNAVVATAHIIEAGELDQSLVLPDSSEVLLYAGSTLRYDSSFNTTDRKLYLKGKGRFTVKKDKQKAFVVYSKHLATTALGTEFEVWEKSDSTSVRLLNGKVSVVNYTAAAAHTVYLLPGQQAMNYKNAAISVHAAASEERWANYSAQKRAQQQAALQQLNFKQASLEKVFNVLQAKYKQHVSFHKEEIAGMMFTGSFGESDQLEAVLRVIANINNLEIQTSAQGFVIKK